MYQPRGKGEGKFGFSHGQRQTKIQHGLMAFDGHGERREKQVYRRALQSAKETLPQPVAGTFGLQRVQGDFHFGRAGLPPEGQYVDPRHHFILNANCVILPANVLQADADRAGLAFAVETQPQLGDGRRTTC